MSEFQEFLNEQFQDGEFRKEWEDIQPEMDVIRAMVDARISQNLTQKELSEIREAIEQIQSNDELPSLPFKSQCLYVAEVFQKIADKRNIKLKLIKNK